MLKIWHSEPQDPDPYLLEMLDLDPDPVYGIECESATLVEGQG